MNDKIMIPICDRSTVADFSTELSMPDYEPEVRRLLRVSVTPTPPEPIFDGARIGMNGELIYDILYCGGDGELYSTKAVERYELGEAFKGAPLDGGLTLLCDVAPESLVSRVTAPRKLSFRCRLRGRMRGFGELSLEEKVSGAGDEASLKRLAGEVDFAQILPSSLARFELSDELALPVGGAWRIICHSAGVDVESAEAGQNEALVSGAVCLSLLVCDEEDGRTQRLERRVQFSETVDAEGITPDCRLVAEGVCTSAEFEVEEGAVSCVLGLCLKINATSECRAEFSRDMYSTEASTDVVMKSHDYPVAERIFSGNLTASLYEPLESVGIDSSAEIVDVTSSAVVKNIEFDRQKWAVVGETGLNILVKVGDEYSSADLKLPFRYEVDGKGGETALAEAAAVALSARAKSDGSRLSADCELQISGRICTVGKFEAVDECVFGAPIEQDDSITVYFPSPTDGAWEVSKRYHVPTEQVISKNSWQKSDKKQFWLV